MAALKRRRSSSGDFQWWLQTKRGICQMLLSAVTGAGTVVKAPSTSSCRGRYSRTRVTDG